MSLNALIVLTSLAAAAYLARRLWQRLLLSRAKHPSLQGHPRISRRVARLLPFYEYDDAHFFRCDGAPRPVEEMRRSAYERLRQTFISRTPSARANAGRLKRHLADAAFTSTYRVPFQFRNRVNRDLPFNYLVARTQGVQMVDTDGQAAYDLSGSYGVNVFGYDFYKQCLEQSQIIGGQLGPALGVYHPVIIDNAERLARLSGLDGVSFHMSGTEAVMQAVRLARYNTGRSRAVRFSGSYHGWWDGVQPGVGGQRRTRDIFTLSEMSERTLRVLRSRRDIACVLVSPLQALHPNSSAPGDASLVASDRGAHFDKAAYSRWLKQLRAVCSERGIVLIFDEVFSGFRLGLGGAQAYFGVAADIVAYGKTLGGGLPVGALCGKPQFMRRYRDEAPADICFARGTFNAHPQVMAAMNAFLQRLESPAVTELYSGLEDRWDAWRADLNAALAAENLPVRLAGIVSVWSVLYTLPGRYNWMFQFYLREQGLHLSWTGTGRLIFSHDYAEDDFQAVRDRFIEAARRMQADGWWWQTPALTNKAIKRRVLREMLAARLRRMLPGRAGRDPSLPQPSRL
ncbi:MAG: glutamate-1-semialdehyde 2,1-aminomutase [Salinisphaeraceae bacterium]|nr:glutamate-1-semialdehyde 2,1-aminomutase [Salinisphaeraceae bacterium]